MFTQLGREGAKERTTGGNQKALPRSSGRLLEAPGSLLEHWRSHPYKRGTDASLAVMEGGMGRGGTAGS